MENKGKKRTTLISILTVLFFVMFIVVFFIRFNDYVDDILYRERLKQMEEVTSQLFAGVDNTVESRWGIALARKNELQAIELSSLNDLYTYMIKTYEICSFQKNSTDLIAIDSTGKYYTKDGAKGLLREVEYIENNPESISYVSNSISASQNSMIFLYRLDNPITLLNNDKEVLITYYGISINMDELSNYFKCEAYDNTNSVYVLDNDGLKLFSSASDKDLIKGYNALTVLENMEYLHGSSFDKTKQSLNENGTAYSNALLNGVEYYYAIKTMDSANWTLLFIVPSSAVATNTVKLVSSITRILTVFTIVIVVAVAITIVVLLYSRQKQIQKIEAIKRYNLEQTNKELDKINEQLRISNEATQSAFEIAKEANKSKSDFLANMSHDIRTPMNAIIGMTTLLEHDANCPDKVIDYTEKIKKASQHLLSLINDVLDMSKIESGKTKLNNIDFSIDDVLDQIDNMFAEQVKDKNQTFTIETKEIHHNNLNGDSVRLVQILNNIISNAVKYTQEGGSVSLKVEELEYTSNSFSKYCFIVKDNGIGIGEDYIDKIFDSFSREENTLINKIQGTGLGMAITKNLVDLMGGTISVESKKGKGTTFEVILTFKVSDKENVQTSDIKDDDTNPSLKGSNLLCAEDNALNAEILKELLAMNGATCTICENGKELVDTYLNSKKDQYDMILMDIQMPIMNGYEATKQIRTQDKNIPIIAMTANTFSEDIERCLKVGMNAHVSKPVDMKVLEKTVHNMKNGGGNLVHHKRC